MLALFPGLPRFLFFGLRSLYTEAEECEKRARLGTSVTWMTSGGHKVDVGEGGRGPCSNNVLDFIIEHSNNSQDHRRSWDRQYSTSTSCPPDVIHVIGVPRPFPFFALFPLRVLYWMQTRKAKKRGRPGIEASIMPASELLHGRASDRDYVRNLAITW